MNGKIFVKKGEKILGKKPRNPKLILEDDDMLLMIEEIPNIDEMNEIVEFTGVKNPGSLLETLLYADNFERMLEILSEKAAPATVRFSEDEHELGKENGKIFIPFTSATSGNLGTIVLEGKVKTTFMVTLLAILDAFASISEGYILSRRSQEILESSIEVLADALEKRVKEGEKVKKIIREIFEKVGEKLYEDKYILKIALEIYDVGKIGVRECILKKSENEMTEDELKEYKKHPEYGYDILKNIQDLPKEVLDAVLYHHERIDGSGFPKGLRGNSIPKIALVVGIIDELSLKLAKGENFGEIMRSFRGKFPNHLIEVLESELG
jgi:HD-GYP domain-containing protein (c-di-GMP phosphodiesterase class II)